jgi:predicted nucleic acid-binding protein
VVTYVFDASAPIRLLDSEPGYQRITEILQSANLGHCVAIMSAVNWGEVVYAIGRRYDGIRAHEVETHWMRYPITIVPADAHRAARAGKLKIKYKIGYADAFGVELAFDSPDHVLVTADYGVKPAEHDVKIEFLPTKPKQ